MPSRSRAADESRGGAARSSRRRDPRGRDGLRLMTLSSSRARHSRARGCFHASPSRSWRALLARSASPAHRPRPRSPPARRPSAISDGRHARVHVRVRHVANVVDPPAAMAASLGPAWRSAVLTAIKKNDKHMPYAKYFQLATVKPNGRPANRTVVYRGFLGTCARFRHWTRAVARVGSSNPRANRERNTPLPPFRSRAHLANPPPSFRRVRGHHHRDGPPQQQGG